ncbi:MAG: outer membrane protein assembly factor BamD [Calditrichaeota bacterium]|nr:MAG: outer membrane protein assembly factor BamD [Calditrichota bacterium]
MRHSMRALSLGLSVLVLFSCGKKLGEEELHQQAQTFEQEEKYDEATKAYETLLKDYPQGQYADEAVQRLAFLYYNNYHDFDKAIAYHERLIKDYPDSHFVPQARFMIGYIYANDLKDYDMARKAYTDFLEHHPDNELVESVKWELKHLGEDVNSQLDELFATDKSNGKTK